MNREEETVLLFPSLLLNLNYKTSSLEAVLHNSELLSPRPHCLSGAVLSLGGKDESLLNSKRCPMSDVKFNRGNSKRPKVSDGIPGGPASVMDPSRYLSYKELDNDLGRSPDLTEPCL